MFGRPCHKSSCIRPYFVQTMPCLLQYKRFEICDARCQTIEDLMNTKQWPSVFEYCYSNISERYFPSASAALRILDFILVSIIHVWKNLLLVAQLKPLPYIRLKPVMMFLLIGVPVYIPFVCNRVFS